MKITYKGFELRKVEFDVKDADAGYGKHRWDVYEPGGRFLDSLKTKDSAKEFVDHRCIGVDQTTECPTCGAGPTKVYETCHYWSRFGNVVFLPCPHTSRIKEHFRCYRFCA